MHEIEIRHETLDALYDELDRDPAIKSEHTRRGYRADLAEFYTWRAGRRFTRRLVEEYAADLQRRDLAPSTINRKLAAVRWAARRLVDMAHEAGGMSASQRQEIITQAERVASISNVSGDRHKRTGRHITAGEIVALISACQDDTTPAGVRDTAIFSIFRAAGLRRSELCGLTMGDLTHHQDGDELTYDLLIQGKGDKTRVVPINNGAAMALADWIALRGDAGGPVFCVISKGGKIQPERSISGDAMRQVQDKREDQAKIPHITLHDWRRTFAGDLLDRGVDLATVADLMGHEDTNTTRKYDRRGDDRKRQAVKGLFVPYKRRDE